MNIKYKSVLLARQSEIDFHTNGRLNVSKPPCLPNTRAEDGIDNWLRKISELDGGIGFTTCGRARTLHDEKYVDCQWPQYRFKILDREDG